MMDTYNIMRNYFAILYDNYYRKFLKDYHFAYD